MNWWYPADREPKQEPVQSDEMPEGEWLGPFHCRECAIDCALFGKLPEQAMTGNHGTEDEKFAYFLVIQ